MSASAPSPSLGAPDLHGTTGAPVVSRRHVVLGLADDVESMGPLAWVLSQAARRSWPVVVVHAWLAYQPGVPGGGVASWTDVSDRRTAAGELAEKAADLLRGYGLDATARVVNGEPGRAILAELQAGDEAVVGTRGGCPLTHLLGSNVIHVLVRHAPSPVVVVPESWQPPRAAHPRVLVGVDGSSPGRAALAWAVTYCGSSGAALVLIHADARGVPTWSARQVSDGELATARAAASGVGVLDVTSVGIGARAGGGYRTLGAATRGAEALVLGNHRASWLGQLSGMSSVDHAAQVSSCPLVVVPATPESDAPGH